MLDGRETEAQREDGETSEIQRLDEGKSNCREGGNEVKKGSKMMMEGNWKKTGQKKKTLGVTKGRTWH